MREEPEHLVLRAFVLALEPLGGSTMELAASVGQKRAVGGLLDERVLEAVLGIRPATGDAEEVEPLQLVERVLAVSGAEHGLEQRQAEVPTERGC